MDDHQKQNDTVRQLSAMVVSAYVQHNSVPRSELVSLIERTHAALSGLGEVPAPAAAEKPVPAVSVKKSITPDAIICLEDGKAYKSLRRHLRTAYSMTPEEYRAKWGLPVDYPMVAPAYAEKRSALAKSLGLGQQRRKAAAAAPAPVEPKPVRGRRKKTEG